MSLIAKSKSLKKTKAKQKIKILLKVEKKTNGLTINLKSKELGKLSKDFYTVFYCKRGDSFDYLPNPNTIIRSIRWNNNYSSNRLIQGNFINLNILEYFRVNNETEHTMVLNNVFTNDEISTYIDQFETMLIKMKQLLYEDKQLKQKIKDDIKDTILIESLSNVNNNYSNVNNNVNSQYMPETIIPSFSELVNSANGLNISANTIHDPDNCILCRELRTNNRARDILGASENRE